MSPDGPALIGEVRRQIEICNACRYCEGFCSVFPAMTRNKAFADGDLTHLANLCHNCRGCYYSCQYTAPHAFDLNLPAALADLRQDSWEGFAWPQGLARAFHQRGVAMAGALVLALAAMVWALVALRPASGEGFYAYMSHGAMVAIFAPAFLLPLLAAGIGLRRYWRAVDAPAPRLADLAEGLRQVATLRNLNGGQGQGCNFEREDRYSDRRRLFHQLTLYGFLLCFGSTTAGTLMHYGLGLEAPYGPLSLPKLLGVPGGILLLAGTLGLAALKLRADPALGARKAWGGEMAFTLLLAAVAATGLGLYAASGTATVPPLLAMHLATVLVLFLTLPYSKMVHGAYRLAALTAESAIAHHHRSRQPANAQDKPGQAP